MTENPRQSTEPGTSGPFGGERLAAARRAHDISATDIAKELHLDERKVRALEQNDFGALGAPVFAKGHLKKYAELVGVPVDDVIAEYYELNRSTGAPPVVRPLRKIRRDYTPGPWITGTVIIIIVLSIAYWWFTRGPGMPLSQSAPGNLAAFVPDTGDATPRDGPGDAADASPRMPADGQDAPRRHTMQASPADSAGGADSVVDAPGLPPQVEVELAFTGECWTEVTDASGRILFYDLAREGRAVTLSGDEPLEIILGDYEHVHLAVDGRDYSIPESARRGRMARLTINRQ